MSLKLIADENILFKIITQLRNKSFDVLSILENSPGISDQEVLKKCVDKQTILLTEDSDFGEWIFSHHKENSGVIFLRYQFHQIDNLISKLLFILDKYNEKLYKHFTVITANKIRMRKL